MEEKVKQKKLSKDERVKLCDSIYPKSVKDMLYQLDKIRKMIPDDERAETYSPFTEETIGEKYDRIYEAICEKVEDLDKTYHGIMEREKNNPYGYLYTEAGCSEYISSHILQFVYKNGFIPEYISIVFKTKNILYDNAHGKANHPFNTINQAKERQEMQKYINPGEIPRLTEISKRMAADHKPETNLSLDEIEFMDKMSSLWLNRWQHFSLNWMWVIPVLLLCIVVKKGLISAICLITFMIIGSIFEVKVKEYCSIIVPWYEKSGKLFEKRKGK